MLRHKSTTRVLLQPLPRAASCHINVGRFACWKTRRLKKTTTMWPWPSPTSSTTILLLFYLVLEVAAFQQNMGKIGFFWHIDSLHFDANFTLNGDRNNYCWKDPKSPSILRPSGQLGDYQCDSSSALISSVLSFMKSKMGDNVDFILWTGNSVPQSPNFPLANVSAQESVLTKVTEMFKLNFPYTTVYPALGNLDVVHPSMFTSSHHSSNGHHHKKRRRGEDSSRRGGRRRDDAEAEASSAYQARQTTYKHAAHLWQNWLPPTAIDSLRKGGYYSIELAGSRLRLVALNMNIYLEDIADEMRFRRIRLRGGRGGGGKKSVLKGQGDPAMEAVTNPDPEEQWAWLARVMETAKRKRQNVILFGHSPPGKYERSSQVSSGVSAGMSSMSSDPLSSAAAHSVLRGGSQGQHWLQERFNHRYLDFVRRYADIIVGQFFGHQHSDSFRVFRDKTGNPISWALLNPSVSPFKISANGLLVESSNPAVRLYRYNTFTGEIYDYAQYYLDLAEANRQFSSSSDSSSSSRGDGGQATVLTQPGLANEAALAASSLTSAGANSNILTSTNTNQRQLHQHGLWRMEYNFTTLYDLEDVNPNSMDRLAKLLQANQTWFDAYFRTNMVGYEGPWLCSQMCRAVQNCAIANVDYNDFSFCVKQAEQVETSGQQRQHQGASVLLLLVPVLFWLV